MPTHGCCCCTATFSDDFNRTNSTSLGSDWSEEAGDWSINTFPIVALTWPGDGKGLNISTANAIAICQTPIDSPNMLNFNVYIRPYKKVNSGTLEYRIILDWVDSSNYMYAQWSHGGGGTAEEISLVRVTSGTPSTLGSLTYAYTDADPSGFVVAVRSDKITVECYGSNYTAFPTNSLVVYGETITSGYVGIGTGSIPSGETVKFDHFYHATASGGSATGPATGVDSIICGDPGFCACCNADSCDGTIVRVTIPSGTLANTGGSYCSSCSTLNGTYDLTFRGYRSSTGTTSTGGRTGCVWQLDLAGTCEFFCIWAVATSTGWTVFMMVSPISSFGLRLVWEFSGTPLCSTGNGTITSSSHEQAGDFTLSAPGCDITGQITLEVM